MAMSGTFGDYTGTTNNEYIHALIYWEATNNHAANTVTIQCWLRAHRTNSFSTTGTGSFDLTIGGVVFQDRNTSRTITSAGNTDVCYGAYTFACDSNGDFSCSVSATGELVGTTWDSTAVSGTIVTDRNYYVPQAPTGLTAARASTMSNSLSWINVSTVRQPANNVDIEVSVNGGGYAALVTDGTGNSYTHNNVSATSTYKYRVQTKNSIGESPYSNESNTTVVIPYAPSACSVAQTKTTNGDGSVSVTKNTVTITLPGNTSHPYTWTGSKIERWDNVSNSWTEIGTLTGTATSYEDTSIVSERSYAYRARSYNTAGYSSYTTSSNVYTQPYAPTTISAVKSGTTITLSWLNPSNIETSVQVYHSTSSDGGNTWSAWNLETTLAANSTSTIITNNDTSRQHKFYVRNAAPGSIYSTPLTSDPILLLQAPNAPSITGQFASFANYYDAEETSFLLSWTHNPTDGTTQTKYDLQVREQGQAWPAANAQTSSAQSQVVSNILNNKTYEWRVQTWGGHADASPWSATGTFKTSARPTVEFVNPAPDRVTAWPSSSIVIEHSSEGTTQAAKRIELWSGNGASLLWFSEVEDNTTSTTVDYVMADDTSYLFKIKAKDAHEMWSATQTKAITVDYAARPSTPTALAAVTASVVNGAGHVAWTAPNPIVNAYQRIRIERWDNVTQQWSLITTVTNNGSGTYDDATIEANRKYRYRAIAVAATELELDPGNFLISTAVPTTQADYIYTTPAAPSDMRVSQPGAYVVLTWTKNVSYDGSTVRIQRSSDNGNTWDELAIVSGDRTSYVDTTALPSTHYHYQIRSEYE